MDTSDRDDIIMDLALGVCVAAIIVLTFVFMGLTAGVIVAAAIVLTFVAVFVNI